MFRFIVSGGGIEPPNILGPRASGHVQTDTAAAYPFNRLSPIIIIFLSYPPKEFRNFLPAPPNNDKFIFSKSIYAKIRFAISYYLAFRSHVRNKNKIFFTSKIVTPLINFYCFHCLNFFCFQEPAWSVGSLLPITKVRIIFKYPKKS